MKEENECFIGIIKKIEAKSQESNFKARSVSTEGHPWLVYISVTRCCPGTMLGVQQAMLKVV